MLREFRKNLITKYNESICNNDTQDKIQCVSDRFISSTSNTTTSTAIVEHTKEEELQKDMVK